MNPVIENLGRRVRRLITRGTVNLCDVSNPIRALLQVNGLGGSVHDKVELHLPYGMSANVPAGGDVLVLMVTGTSSHLIALHCDDSALRITDLQQGEFGFQDQDKKQIIFRQGQIEIITPTGKNIVITSGQDLDVTVAGKVQLNVTGDVDATIGGKIDANVTGDCDLTVGGQTNLTCTGKFVGSAAEWDLTGNLKVTGTISGTSTITASGDIASTGGNVSDNVRSMAADRTIYDGHSHGNVQNGSGYTGLPDNLQ